MMTTTAVKIDKNKTQDKSINQTESSKTIGDGLERLKKLIDEFTKSFKAIVKEHAQITDMNKLPKDLQKFFEQTKKFIEKHFNKINIKQLISSTISIVKKFATKLNLTYNTKSKDTTTTTKTTTTPKSDGQSTTQSDEYSTSESSESSTEESTEQSSDSTESSTQQSTESE
ncbi:uncharacterized protein LOC128953688 [Oppia nitens]|uniref:uncharacterized protein LOC128953688 n=1 Tax=Oppia nitens TaxID=1686743 RepID=UPI0023DB0B6B|nr:uncharacterized protein LOC128953688 [Oppia nitens]